MPQEDSEARQGEVELSLEPKKGSRILQRGGRRRGGTRTGRARGADEAAERPAAAAGVAGTPEEGPPKASSVALSWGLAEDGATRVVDYV